MGALCERKGAAAGTLEIALSGFRFLLARRLGIPSAAAIAELMRSVQQRPGWMIPRFAETLGQIKSAVKLQQVTEPQALEWVGTLYNFAHRLGVEG